MTTNFSKHFVTRLRSVTDPDSAYVTLADDRPDWLQDAVRAAHQGTLPNDWIYAECRAAVEAFDDNGGDIDEDAAHEYVDGRVEVMTKELFQWAADFCLTDTWASAEEEAADAGLPEMMDSRIAAVQYAAVRHIAETMFEACREHAGA